MAHDEVKKEPYLKINPNGRTPAIIDPNNADLVLWESGAILEYLVETYDAERRAISFPLGTPERWHAQQFLHFQTSGQGPYFGQTTWFRKFHGEDVPSAKKRYDEQLVRVVGVLDGLLEGKTYLVGEKWCVPPPPLILVYVSSFLHVRRPLPSFPFCCCSCFSSRVPDMDKPD